MVGKEAPGFREYAGQIHVLGQEWRKGACAAKDIRPLSPKGSWEMGFIVDFRE